MCWWFQTVGANELLRVNSGYKHFACPTKHFVKYGKSFGSEMNFTKEAPPRGGWADRDFITGNVLSKLGEK